jgi:hypothetical protein
MSIDIIAEVKTSLNEDIPWWIFGWEGRTGFPCYHGCHGNMKLPEVNTSHGNMEKTRTYH